MKAAESNSTAFLLHNYKIDRAAPPRIMYNDMAMRSTRGQLIPAAIVALLVLSFTGKASAAKYAGESFTLGAGARALALGGAYTAVADDPTGVYYNPAGLALVRRNEVVLLHSETFGSLLNHDFAAFSHPALIGGRAGALAAGVYRVGGGGIELTEWDEELGRPVVTSEVSHYDYLLLLGSGMGLSDKLRAGATAKVIVRSLGNDSGYGLGVDLGMQYDLRQNLTAALALINATSSFISYDNGTKESILPAVRIGGSWLAQFDRFALRLVADGEFLFEGRRYAAQFWMKDVSLDTRFGAELSYYDLVAFRAGSDIGRLTLGVGLKVDRFVLDGAFLDHNDLDNSYRVSLRIGL